MQGKTETGDGRAGFPPAISVAVPADREPLRLRWLLNALEEQALDRSLWEVVVAHESRHGEIGALLAEHPLCADGTLRRAQPAAGSTTAAARRNAAWRLTRAPLVLFTEEDCRPPPDWLERALAAAHRHPGTVIQGACLPDPDEWPVTLGAPRFRTRYVSNPPAPWSDAANLICPRSILERLGGFDERVGFAGATDLCARARDAEFRCFGAPDVRVHRAAHEETAAERIRRSSGLRKVPGLIRAHPDLRSELPAGVLWRRSHARLAAAAIGIALARRHPAFATLALPWALGAVAEVGVARRGIGALASLPGALAIDAAEVVALAWGSVRHRTPVI